ncbi:hypothetical protein HPB52_010897 [Rhipicephalus sanguineus]|uniref:Uncharacterized protein n=1 Tax=Rhipicephalus sanguineus TaxID=34632 RepID=A0A9D4PZJ0_RHISA|nr:hypothetical protein HPB52_010897 [Rhipicephalus sanguineus]
MAARDCDSDGRELDGKGGDTLGNPAPSCRPVEGAAGVSHTRRKGIKDRHQLSGTTARRRRSRSKGNAELQSSGPSVARPDSRNVGAGGSSNSTPPINANKTPSRTTGLLKREGWRRRMGSRPPEFDETASSWDAYRVRLEAYFEGSDITDSSKRRALSVASLSDSVVRVLQGRCPSTPVNSLTYEDVLKVLEEHYSPQVNETAASDVAADEREAAGTTRKNHAIRAGDAAQVTRNTNASMSARCAEIAALEDAWQGCASAGAAAGRSGGNPSLPCCLGFASAHFGVFVSPLANCLSFASSHFRVAGSPLALASPRAAATATANAGDVVPGSIAP